ncbi:hypothetical protein JOC55_001829 [Paenibacillus sacheonensis]|nr:hypothetical protein [Paenibacillus sacheonensis]
MKARIYAKVSSANTPSGVAFYFTLSKPASDSGKRQS